ncbi:lysylphosphatidylglycerol synthase transmembrane domain-containing protein [Amycolatopsis alkalitolerans]|uniref:UPF0104 family protein n=1 Tax=Amycolatopsis alkalitolerans TaxID=2547244 RepID=A0A5C4LZ35_9PSEU|nr:lysylphosphatidylglycerol synthase transmembrane domain-containing protein [Amycolatopsis alkalitolerans]TNC23566.1 UPF0104 family protein [Amycolatopsis alkalitolerans]
MFNRIWPWLKLLVGAGILGVLVWRVGSGAFLAGLRAIDGPALAAALVIGLATTVASAWRWCLVARRLGLPLKLGEAVTEYYRALLLNAVLPAGVLGDVHRAVSHGQQSGAMGRGVRAVFLERFAGQVVLIAVAVVVLLADPGLAGVLPGGDTAIAVVGVVLAAGALAAAARWGRGLLDRSTLPGVMLLSALTVVGHVTMYLVAIRASGLHAPVTTLVPLVVLTLLVMGLPVNIGGYGPREAFAAVAFGAAGLGAAHGVTAAVVYGVLTLVAALPGALVLFLRGQPNRARCVPKVATSAASTSLPLPAVAREGRPMTPDSV